MGWDRCANDEIAVGDLTLKKGDIKTLREQLNTAFLLRAINLYRMYRNHGQPWGSGWAMWPAWYADLVNEFDAAEQGCKIYR